MNTRPQRILLTGGAGFIGSHLAEALLRAGANLTIIDNLNDFYNPSIKLDNLEQVKLAGEFEFCNLDICDIAGLQTVFERVQPQAVVHLAAYAGVRPSIEKPLLYERVNIAGTLNLLELCRIHKVPKLVFGSSSSVYGASNQVPFSEDQIALRPISPYAATKVAGELIAYTYASLYGISINCLRFFTVFGPRQRPDLAIHKFTALIEAGRTVPVFGDGSTGRDYTYVDDIVSGILAALDYEPEPDKGVRFEVFNLGNSHPVLLSELLDNLAQVTGREVICQQQPDQPGDVPITWADISKARRLLGYNPQTPLRKGLESFVAWYRSSAGVVARTAGEKARQVAA